MEYIIYLDWPKYKTGEYTDDIKYSKFLIGVYGSENQTLNFEQFCRLMEALWDNAEGLAEKVSL